MHYEGASDIHSGLREKALQSGGPRLPVTYNPVGLVLQVSCVPRIIPDSALLMFCSAQKKRFGGITRTRVGLLEQPEPL